jgi:hypothetical protein
MDAGGGWLVAGRVGGSFERRVPPRRRVRPLGPVGAFADPNFSAPRVSVWEDRMHPWVGLPDGTEHIG